MLSGSWRLCRPAAVCEEQRSCTAPSSSSHTVFTLRQKNPGVRQPVKHLVHYGSNDANFARPWRTGHQLHGALVRQKRLTGRMKCAPLLRVQMGIRRRRRRQWDCRTLCRRHRYRISPARTTCIEGERTRHVSRKRRPVIEAVKLPSLRLDSVGMGGYHVWRSMAHLSRCVVKADGQPPPTGGLGSAIIVRLFDSSSCSSCLGPGIRSTYHSPVPKVGGPPSSPLGWSASSTQRPQSHTRPSAT